MAGGLVGAVTGVIVSSAGLFLGSQFSTSGCGVAIAVGTVLVVLAAALGFVAWKLIRQPGQGPALVFARGATGV
ncbi:MAG TPA: hypothetical protein VHT53_09625, partial [Candidatus Elarobacter sp.]|nr:hypothetical protein [Candidatus Elarobacter sp.]